MMHNHILCKNVYLKDHLDVSDRSGCRIQFCRLQLRAEFFWKKVFWFSVKYSEVFCSLLFLTSKEYMSRFLCVFTPSAIWYRIGDKKRFHQTEGVLSLFFLIGNRISKLFCFSNEFAKVCYEYCFMICRSFHRLISCHSTSFLMELGMSLS